MSFVLEGHQDVADCLLGLSVSRAAGGAENPLAAAVVTSGPGIATVDLETLQVVQQLQGAHADRITSVKFSNTEPHVLAGCGRDGTMRLWDLRQPNGGIPTVLRVATEKADAEVWCLDWSISDQFLAVGSENAVLVYDRRGLTSVAKRAKKGAQPVRRFTGHSDIVTACKFHPSHEDVVVSGGDDSLIFVWTVSDRVWKPSAVTTGCNVGDDDEEDSTDWADADGVVSVIANQENVRDFSFVGPNALATVSSTDVVRTWQSEDLEKISAGRGFTASSAEPQAVELGAQFGVRLGLDTSKLPAWGGGHRTTGATTGSGTWSTTAIRDHPLLKVDDSSGFVVDTIYDSVSERFYVVGGSTLGHMLLFHANLEEVDPVAAFEDRRTSATGHSGPVRAFEMLMGGRGSGPAALSVGEDGRLVRWKWNDSCPELNDVEDGVLEIAD